MNPILIPNHRCASRPGTPLRTLAMAAGASVLLVAGATSCSTTKGFGRDIEKTGEKIQDASYRATH